MRPSILAAACLCHSILPVASASPAVDARSGIQKPQPDVLIELTPSRPGPYDVQDDLSLDVDVAIRNLNSAGHEIRLAQFDFTLTDPLITLEPPFEWSGLLGSSPFYNRTTGFPRPAATYTAAVGIPGFIATLPAEGSVSAGTVRLALPTAVGDYELDLVNADETNPNRGAMISFGFGIDPPLCPPWGLPCRPEIGGGVLTLSVVPEPASLVLMSAGVAALALGAGMRFRRSERHE